MCTVLILRHAHPVFPLLIAANRDEMIGRPATGLEVQGESPRVLAGRDLERGGTWMGVTAHGFFAGLTNLRPTERPMTAPRSRGEVVLAVLRAGEVGAACAYLDSLAPADFNGGQLVFGDARDLRVAYFRPDAPRVRVERVPEGVHVLPTSVLDDPSYPKVGRLRAAALDLPRDWPGVRARLIGALASHVRPEANAVSGGGSLFEPETLRALDAVCIHLPGYGTRSALLLAARPGAVDHVESSNARPCEGPFVDYTPVLNAPSPERVETLVLGAGPSGLAASAALTEAGLPHLLVDRGGRVGDSWRRHYDRLRLHTLNRWSSLPGLPFDENAPEWRTRDDFVAYLETYARTLGVRPRHGIEVRGIRRREGDGFRVDTSGGPIDARFVVVATGLNRVPHRPPMPGEGTFRGTIVHSGEHRSAVGFQGRRVAVFGIGNSGAELALDFAEQGASVLLVWRSPAWIVRRTRFGIPSQRIGVFYETLPKRLAGPVSLFMARRAGVPPSLTGIPQPEQSPVDLVRGHGRVPLIDIGTVAAIEDGRIRTVEGLQTFTPDGFVDARGEAHAVDHVVLATGWRPGLEALLPDPALRAEVLDERGRPRLHAQVHAGGLAFVGFANRIGGALREVSLETPRLLASLREAR